MKKAIAVVLILAVCLCMGAWTHPQHLEVYEKMNAASADVTAMEMVYTGVVDTTVDSQTVSQYMNGEVAMIMKGDNDFDMSMAMSIKTVGQTVTTSAYYTGGVMYQEAEGMKIKYALDVDSAMSQATILDTDIDRALVLSSSLNENDPDGIRLTIKVDTNLVNELSQDMLGSMGLGAMNATVQELTYSFLLDDDYNLKEMDMYMDATQSIGGTVARSVSQVNCRVISTNAANITVSIPADLDTYEELDLNALLNAAA